MRQLVISFTLVLFSTLIIPASVSGGEPVGGDFTYQGLLEYQGAAANGQYDFLVVLHESSAGSDALEAEFVPDVTVVDGLFTLNLSFNPDFFDGSQRWLKLFVNIAGSAELPGLSPRQRINAVPYAVQSEFALDGLTENFFTENSDGIGYSGGKVEIGGLPTSANSDFQVDAATGESPIRFRVGGITRMMLHPNGGTSLGSSDSSVGSNGLLVEGDTLLRGTVQQPLANHGLVKAGIVATCSTTSTIDRSFNAVNGRAIIIDSSIAQGAGQCAFTFPFSLSDTYYQVMVQRQNDTRLASCSNPDSTTLICNVSNLSGTNVTSIIHIIVY